MAGWKRIVLSREDVVSGMHFDVQSEFEDVFMAYGAHEDAAMYAAREPTQGYVCYFSPLAAEIFSAGLLRYRPEDVLRPSKDDVTLLVGHESARHRLPS